MLKLRHVLVLFTLVLFSSCVGLFEANEDNVAAMFFLTPFILAVVYAFQYYLSYSKERFGEQHFDWKKYRQWGIVLIVAPAVIVFVNFLPEKFFENPENKASYAQLVNDDELLLEAYRESVLAHPDSIACHVQYVELIRAKAGMFSTTTNKLEALYAVSARSPDPTKATIGTLVIGIMHYFEGAYELALTELEPLANQEVPFANLYVAKTLRLRGDVQQATERFQREIDLGRQPAQAYQELAYLYVDLGMEEQLQTLLASDKTLAYIPFQIAEEHYFLARNWTGFSRALFRRFLNPLNWSGFLAALLIAGIWFWYVRSVDVFQPENWLLLLLTFVFGAVSPVVVFFISSWATYDVGITMSGGFWDSLVYSIVGIGLIEEFAKILPLLFILGFTKVIKEPYDYILYASISALGFAFTENLLYFQASKLEIIHGRAFISVVGHMSWSSLAAYGLVLARFRYKHWNPAGALVLFLAIAAVAHGLFDFWLIGPIQIWLASIIVFLFGVQVWWTIQNNCVNNSPAFDFNELKRLDNLQFYLVIALSGIFLFQYVLVGINMGPATANYALFRSFLKGGYFIVFLSTSIGRFDVFHGYWEPIKIPYSLPEIFIPKVANPGDYLGKRIDVFAEAGNKRMNAFLPRKGTIVARRAIGLDKYWYLVKLEQYMGIGNYEDDHLLIQFAYDDASLEKENYCEAELRLLKNRKLVERIKGNRQDVSKAGEAMIKKRLA